MKVSIETTSGLERRLTVGVPAERVEGEVDSRLKKAAHNVKLNGFRPGKVPFKVVKQRFGAGVRQEVIGDLVNQTFYEAIVQEKLQPAGAPSIDATQVAAGKDLEYVATFEVYPDVQVAQPDGVEIERPVAEVTDADVEKMIDVFRNQQASWEAVERAAADGDKVNIDYKGTKDGEAFEGGSADGSDLTIGSGRMIPGFEEGIVGMAAGDEKVLDLTFPEEYHAEGLKGAAVQFAIKVNSVSAQVLPELNEEFFGKYGVESGNEEEFRAEIKKNMERELKNAVKNKVKTAVLDALLQANNALQIPNALIATEIKALKEQALQQYGMPMEGFDLNLLPDDMFSEQAKRRVALGLLMGEIIKVDELKADADKVRAMVEDIASTYQEPEEVISYYYENKEQLQGVEGAVLEDQVVEKLLASVTVTDKASSYEEALAPPAPKAAEAEESEEA